MTAESQTWYGVRCVLHDAEVRAYEERVTIWRCADFDQAIALAEDEIAQYAEGSTGLKYVGLAQAYRMDEGTPGAGSEVFSLIRNSDLEPDAYVKRFFDDGQERQGHL
nr:hypothetical protein [uncultured organism]